MTVDDQAIKLISKLQGFISKSEKGNLLSGRITMEEKYFIVSGLEKLLHIADSAETLSPLVRTDLLGQLADYLKIEGKSCISTVTGRFSLCDHTFKLAFPVLWPQEFEFYDCKTFGVRARHKYLPNRFGYDPFCLFLGLSLTQYNHLFSPGEQIAMLSGLTLRSTHGRETLVKHINQFCDYIKKRDIVCV